jgi:FAD-dependent urate hydroxylase
VVRTLIVGAGVAGLTLAGGLCRQGRPPVIIERSGPGPAAAGYAIGLYPLGSCVLHGLGAYRQLVDRSLVAKRYVLASGSGRVLQAVDMSVLTGAAGPLLMVSRSDLVGLLEASCRAADLRRGVTIDALAQDPDGVEVTFAGGSAERFDAVIGCDGIGSATRDLASVPATRFDAGWLLWTWWADGTRFDPEVAREWCGPGWMFGVYPVPGRVMCAAGGPVGALPDEDVRTWLRRRLSGLAERAPAVGAAMAGLDAAHPWPMRDVRSGRWASGRVALCGDAAAGFLPTAGIGASSAMRAAAGLADELSRADVATVPLALELYEKRCRRIIERHQAESRRLARVMFVRHRPVAWARDHLVRRYPAGRALGQIIESVRRPF